MAPIRSSAIPRRRSSFSLLNTRRRSLAPPKNYTFAPNVTPISYPSDPNSPTSATSADGTPNDHHDAIKEGDEHSAPAHTPAPSRPRRRGGRRDSEEHIPRPPNAFMLFRQNFVHQRHVPGSIETNHFSLSKIVGNCWKNLPAEDKKVWEALAEKKKDEHKKLYPDYRFQPKHDPEKKRKRQALRLAAEKAEREREEQKFAAGEQNDSNGNSEAQERERAMAVRRQAVRSTHNHLGHRRSSSVPLPNEAYGYPYNPYAHGHAPHADPFNFANPALAHAPPNAASSGSGITLPSLPSNLSNLVGSWYAPNASQNGNASGSGSPALGGEEQRGGPQLTLPPHLMAHQQLQIPMTLSRASSPRPPPHSSFAPMNFGMNGGNAGFTGVGSGLGLGMNPVGMGARAARQHQLGQLGRRASSTQPSLQHQLSSGAFSHYPFGTVGGFPHPHASGPFDFNASHHNENDTHFGGFDGFVGAVAEGFTNPFAPSSTSASASTSTSNSNANSTAHSATSASPSSAAAGGYPAPLAPHAMWYEVDSVDPMTPIGAVPVLARHLAAPPPLLPEVDTALLDPTFNFGTASTGGEPASPAATASAVPVPPNANASANDIGNESDYSANPVSHSASTADSGPGTGGMRESFDFGAFSAFFAGLPHDQRQYQQNLVHQQLHNQNLGHQQQQHHNIQNQNQSQQQQQHAITPHSAFTLAQPVPMRKVVPPSVPEAGSYYGAELELDLDGVREHEQVQVHGYNHPIQHHAHQHAYPASQPSASESTSAESSANASPASARSEVAGVPQHQLHQHQTQHEYQHQHQQQHEQSQLQLQLQQMRHEDIVSGHELLDGAVDVSIGHSHTHSHSHSQTNAGLCAVGDALDYTYGMPHALGLGLGMHGFEEHGVDMMGMGIGADGDAMHMGLGVEYGGYAQNAAPGAHMQQAEDTGSGAEANNGNGADMGPRFSFSDYVHSSPFLSAAIVN